MDIFCPRISAKVEHRLVELECASDILRFSCVAQNSISYLDLQPQDVLAFVSFPFRDDSTHSILMNLASLSDVPNPECMINTEEKCRKVLSSTRNFLYRFHLDLPKKRESSLKDGPKPENMKRHDALVRHIGKITVKPNLYFSILSSLVKEAVKRSDKTKMIKWLVAFNAVKDFHLEGSQAYFFAKYVYREVNDSAFVKDFLKIIRPYSLIRLNDKPEVLEFFLYHLRQNRVNIARTDIEPIEVCIQNRNFRSMAPILKYQDAPRVPQPKYAWMAYARCLPRFGLDRDVLLETQKWMSSKRFYLMTQLLFIFFDASPTPSASECLRLLWNSLPDAFFSFEEIEMALQAVLSSQTIRDVYNYYSGAVGVFHKPVEPRSLMDLSRTTVRRILWESGCWIPDGIRLTGLPRELQSFLNLEA